MLSRLLVAVLFVCFLMPREPDVGFGRPGADISGHGLLRSGVQWLHGQSFTVDRSDHRPEPGARSGNAECLPDQLPTVQRCPQATGLSQKSWSIVVRFSGG